MKKINLKELLGLTQIDLAILFKTTRSQISLFELGKRDLPINAKILLAEILQFLQKEKDNPEIKVAIQKEETSQTKKALEAMLKQNKYQQYVLEKKHKAAEKKYCNALTALSLANYLEKNNDENDKLSNGMFQIIRNGALSNLKTTNQALLTQYQIKKEVLEAEKKILLEHLKG